MSVFAEGIWWFSRSHLTHSVLISLFLPVRACGETGAEMPDCNTCIVKLRCWTSSWDTAGICSLQLMCLNSSDSVSTSSANRHYLLLWLPSEIPKLMPNNKLSAGPRRFCPRTSHSHSPSHSLSRVLERIRMFVLCVCCSSLLPNRHIVVIFKMPLVIQACMCVYKHTLSCTWCVLIHAEKHGYTPTNVSYVPVYTNIQVLTSWAQLYVHVLHLTHTPPLFTPSGHKNMRAQKPESQKRGNEKHVEKMNRKKPTTKVSLCNSIMCLADIRFYLFFYFLQD